MCVAGHARLLKDFFFECLETPTTPPYGALSSTYFITDHRSMKLLMFLLLNLKITEKVKWSCK
jgi:hypothetical protein